MPEEPDIPFKQPIYQQQKIFMKQPFLISAFPLLLIAVNSYSQQARPGTPIGGIVVKGGKNPGGNMLLNIGGGISSPNSAFKNQNNTGNFTDISIGVYVPILEYGGATGGVITFGFNAGAAYFMGNKDYGTGNYAAYKIMGNTNDAASVAKGTGSPKQPGFKTEAGVQANFSFGKITVSPILNGSYFNFKQKEFSVTQTGSVNGQTKELNLYNQKATKTNGFAFIPKLRLSYFAGKVGFFAEGNYTAGPGVTTTTTVFKPNGTANADGFYSIDQMLTGKFETADTKKNFNAFGINVGISLPLGRSISEKGVRANKPNNRRRVEVLKSNATESSEPNAVSSIGTLNGTAGNGAVSTSYAAGKMVSDNSSEKSISEKGLKRNEATPNERLSMTPTTTKQTQDNSFGEKVASGLQTANKSINEKGVKRSEAASTEPKRTYSGGRKNEIPVLAEGKIETVSAADAKFINSLFVKGENGMYTLDAKQFTKVSSDKDLKNHRFVMSKNNERFVYKGDENKVISVLAKYKSPIVTLPQNYVKQCDNCTTRTCENHDGTSTTYTCGCVNGFCYCPLCVIIDRLKPLDDE